MKRRLSLEEKLAALQEIDSSHKWYSLDDQRVCVLCEKIISGRMIDVWEVGRGIYRFHCPTRGCPSSPRDWFYHSGKRAAPPRAAAKRRAPAVGLDSPAFS